MSFGIKSRFQIIVIALVILLALIGVSPYFGAKKSVENLSKLHQTSEDFSSIVIDLEKKIGQIELAERSYFREQEDIYLVTVNELDREIMLLINEFEELTGNLAIRNFYGIHKSYFEKIKSNILQEGREDKGVIGLMRKDIHKLEDMFKNNLKLKAMLLEIRRAEKDYLLRRKSKYVIKVSEYVEKLKRLVGEKEDSLLVDYMSNFTMIVDNYNERLKLYDSWNNALTEAYVVVEIELIKKRNSIDFTFSKNLTEQFQYLYLMLATAFLNLIGILVLVRLFIGKNKQLALANSETQKEMKEKEKFQEQLIAKEKLASLGSVAAGIAHEIKNPLNYIKTSSSNIRDFFEGDLKEYMDRFKSVLSEDEWKYFEEDVQSAGFLCDSIDEGSDRADKIITRMLDLTGTGEEGEEVLDLSSILNESLTLALNEVNYIGLTKLSVDKNFGSKKKFVGKKYEIQKLFVNIFSNSIYFINERVKQDRSFQGNIKIFTRDDENSIEVLVEDNGIGLEIDNVSKVYEPFFTTKPTGTGVGLGLSLAYEIVKQHNGSIESESKLNHFKTHIKLGNVIKE